MCYACDVETESGSAEGMKAALQAADNGWGLCSTWGRILADEDAVPRHSPRDYGIEKPWKVYA